MDWSSLLAGGPFAGMLSSSLTTPPAAAADPTAAPAPTAAPGAPMNILPPAAQQAAAAPAAQPGILNNTQSSDAIAQALKMVQQQPAQTPAQPQIQMSKPVGSAAGFDPSRILAAIRGQALPVT